MSGDTPQKNEDFSFLIWRHIFQLLVEHEKQAVETGETIQFEVEVVKRATRSENISIINFEVVCEPGKPARPLSIRTK